MPARLCASVLPHPELRSQDTDHTVRVTGRRGPADDVFGVDGSLFELEPNGPAAGEVAARTGLGKVSAVIQQST